MTCRECNTPLAYRNPKRGPGTGLCKPCNNRDGWAKRRAARETAAIIATDANHALAIKLLAGKA